MRISIFGLGYVGAVCAGCLSARGHDVIGVDISANKIDLINNGKSPIVEPGLEELLQQGLRQGRLRGTTDVAAAGDAAELARRLELDVLASPGPRRGSRWWLRHLQHTHSAVGVLQLLRLGLPRAVVDVIVVDSVAALTPRAEIEGEMGDHHMALQARLMSQALRKLTAIISKSNTIVIFINQTRQKIGVFFGNPETTTGGTALKFYSSVRLNLRRAAQIKQGEEIIGSRIRAKIVKNKVAAPFKVCEFDIYYNEGISYYADLVQTGVKTEVLKKAGSWFQYENTKLGQGIEGARTFLKENPKIAKEIRSEIFKKNKKEDS